GAEACDAHPEALVIGNRGDLLPKPPTHLRTVGKPEPRYEVVDGVRFLPQLESVTLVEPGGHSLGIHSERNGAEPFESRLALGFCPVRRDGHERLDCPL